MNGPEDYLVDPQAPVDPEIAALEKALAPLAMRDMVWREPAPAAPRGRAGSFVAAAFVLLGITIAFAFVRRDAPLAPFAPQRTFVSGDRAITVPLGALAQIELRPNSELAFEQWQTDHVLFTLRRGSVAARVAPPPVVQPGFFRMDTLLGRVVDQGCRYELEVRDDGTVRVVVTEGAVTFETKERTVFVPAGAGAIVTARGLATPTFRDAAPDLVKATAEFDVARDTAAALERRFMTLKMVLAAVHTKRDSLVLWHLLRDPEPEIRKVAEAELVQLVEGGPGGKTTKAGSADPEEWLAFLRIEVWR